MPAFQIRYINKEDTIQKQETVFMINLTSAKKSATAQSNEHTNLIEIYDLMDRLIAKRTHGKWKNTQWFFVWSDAWPSKKFKREPGKFVCPGETKRSVFTKTNEPATSAARRQLEQRNKVS